MTPPYRCLAEVTEQGLMLTRTPLQKHFGSWMTYFALCSFCRARSSLWRSSNEAAFAREKGVSVRLVPFHHLASNSLSPTLCPHKGTSTQSSRWTYATMVCQQTKSTGLKSCNKWFVSSIKNAQECRKVMRPGCLRCWLHFARRQQGWALKRRILWTKPRILARASRRSQ